jgi:hypothetical protein
MKNAEGMDKDYWPYFADTEFSDTPINIMNDALLFKPKIGLINQSTGSFICENLLCLVISYIVIPNIIDLLKTKTINHKKVISLQIVYTNKNIILKA